jgi:FkbM family methyltransferase
MTGASAKLQVRPSQVSAYDNPHHDSSLRRNKMLLLLKRTILENLPTSLAGRLRAWRVQRLIDTYAPRTVEHDYGGRRLRVYLADPLAAGWYDHDWAPLPEVSALSGAELREGARIFDIGAHQGVVALMLAAELSGNGQVVAVEPSAHNVASARMNAQLNGARQIAFVQAAIADRCGKIMFNTGLNGQLDDGSGKAGRVEVEAVTVDELAIKFGIPTVVFLDVEGAECLALAGATRTLQSGASFCVEVHVGHGLELLGGSAQQVLSSLTSQFAKRMTVNFGRFVRMTRSLLLGFSCLRAVTQNSEMLHHSRTLDSICAARALQK